MGDWSQILSISAFLIFSAGIPVLSYWGTFRSDAISDALKSAFNHRKVGPAYLSLEELDTELHKDPQFEKALIAKETHSRLGWAIGILWALSLVIWLLNGQSLGDDSISFLFIVFLVGLTSALLIYIIHFVRK